VANGWRFIVAVAERQEIAAPADPLSDHIMVATNQNSAALNAQFPVGVYEGQIATKPVLREAEDASVPKGT
jgi:hypothetical protein